MGLQCPKWLSELAKEYWKRVYPEIKERINAGNIDGFSLLCQTYADYRSSTDLRDKKTYLDYFLKLSKEFGLTPRSQRLNVQPISTETELDALFE